MRTFAESPKIKSKTDSDSWIQNADEPGNAKLPSLIIIGKVGESDPQNDSFHNFDKNKKDGYRQQNVRQRQKIISIIDYDVCILEYLQPFCIHTTSKNGLTLKSGYVVLQGH